MTLLGFTDGFLDTFQAVSVSISLPDLLKLLLLVICTEKYQRSFPDIRLQVISVFNLHVAAAM